MSRLTVERDDGEPVSCGHLAELRELVAALELLTVRVDDLDAANTTNGKWSGDAAIARASVILQAREVVSRFKHPEPRG